jgi:hypothetical protein
MADLSPAAQAVLDATMGLAATVREAKAVAAAALRAAADKVVPHEATAPWDELKCDYDGDHWEMRQ